MFKNLLFYMCYKLGGFTVAKFDFANPAKESQHEVTFLCFDPLSVQKKFPSRCLKVETVQLQ